MAILAICSCGMQQRLPNSYDGKEVKCLKCGKMVKVGGSGLAEHRLQVGSITLVARCEPTQVQQADQVLKRLVANHSGGVGLVDRVKIQFGWSELQLQKRGADLWVCEADYSRNPWSDVREDIIVAINVGWSQADLIRKVSAKPMSCTFTQEIQTISNCFSVQELMMRRIKRPKGEDSGWFIGPTDPAALQDAHEKGEYETILSYQLLTLRFGMVQALLLPLEFKALFSGNTLVSVLDGDDREVLGTE
ncbi:MAG TPA: hypothetical protein VLR94_08775 [Acidobacteriota bacterium]|nr:hypothetical protein [Acidobacteriota bacterium]